jgi:hypothetical protein
MPYLYDKTHPCYPDKQRREEGYQLLLNIYRQYDPNYDMKTFTKKLDNMRSAYYRELRKVSDILVFILSSN